MRIFDVASDRESDREASFPLVGIQHTNFVDVCEAYLFRNEAFLILEYVGFSVEDLLQHSLLPTEREIAYIMN